MNDVCLVLEGTYPKLVGGVSTWVHDLTTALPDVRFAVARIASEDEPARACEYAPPANVTVAQAADGLPPARAYHALSTGLAGETARLAARSAGVPFLLTEHGLAWHEAALGLPAAYQYNPELRADAHLELARRAYAEAAAVVTVCAHNARAQRGLGARPLVIENAADAAEVTRIRDGIPRVGLVARVTPVKDVLTFVRACALVAGEIPEAEFVVIGPLDHDASYAERCVELSRRLGVAVTFTGEASPRAWLPKLDVVALTSVSEAQPLALLEAMGAGLPVVATDVGGCRELVTGAGLVVPPASPAATAGAIVTLMRDPGLRRRMGAAGRGRVLARHRPELLADRYRRLYEEHAWA
ncbi:MAG: GT4 family glycosyltransferase PelF [Actinobacteria bacterium]|nr:GT4 family glycosyltransferase PelF [Actinomycetota bacterium]